MSFLCPTGENHIRSKWPLTIRVTKHFMFFYVIWSVGPTPPVFMTYMLSWLKYLHFNIFIDHWMEPKRILKILLLS